MSIEALKERLSGVKPYRPSPYVEQLSGKTGINPCDILKLDANENLFLSKHFFPEVVIPKRIELTDLFALLFDPGEVLEVMKRFLIKV